MLNARPPYRTRRSVLAFILCGMVGACSKTDTPTTLTDAVASVAVSPGSATLTWVGETVQLTGSATRASGGTVSGGTYTWSSADAAVATVSSTGLVTAVSEGATTVSATLEGVAGTATVTVGLLANSVIVTPSTATLVTAGESLQLTLEVRDAGGTVISSAGGAWASSAPAVATVSTTGGVVAVASGTTDVTYALGTSTSSAAITVEIPVPGAATWDVVSSSVASQRGIWGSSPTDYWSVGTSGSILHFDGSAWSESPSVTSELLEGIWGSAADDIWAVGWNGTMLHYDGSQWGIVDISSVTTEHLRSVWGSGRARPTCGQCGEPIPIPVRSSTTTAQSGPNRVSRFRLRCPTWREQGRTMCGP